MTEAGMIIGTAAYMSPEQARGKAVDKRSDVWAFGCVLYEMLSGRRAFDGEDATEIISAVMKSEPEWSALPQDVPAHLRAIITRCLVKDRKTRIPDLSVVRFMLDGSLTAAAPERPATARASSFFWKAATATLATALIAGLLVWAPWRHTSGLVPHKLLVSIGADASLTTALGAAAILSPDGATLVFAAQQAGKTLLFVRKLDQLQAATLAGTEGASSPFFSPDGQWIAFFAAGKLKKVSVTGGATVNLCDAPGGRGGAWTEDDAILFTPSGGLNTTLMRVSASGGEPKVFGPFSPGAITQRWPQILPAGRGVLFTEHTSIQNFDEANLVVAPLLGGTPKVVVRGGYYGRYVPSGHLIYMKDGTLFATPFDLNRLETIGPAVPALEGVATQTGAQVALSADGTLVYAPGAAAAADRPIDWMTRDGKTTILRAAKAAWGNPRFSPDGQKLALDIFDGKQRDIWVYEWTRDILTQVTFEKGNDERPIWTPDGRRIVFSSDRAQPGVRNLYWVNADGTGETTRLTESPGDQRADSWHPGGRFLAYIEAGPGRNGRDLMILPMEGDATTGLTPGKPTVFLDTPANESAPQFSPDGRWIAYVSDESRNAASTTSADIYVRPFPGPGGKWRISTAGGIHPHWSASSRELLFELQDQILVAPYSVSAGSFQPEKAQLWSPTRHRNFSLDYTYDIHPDGKRLAILAAREESSGAVQDKVVFFFSFGEYLKKIAPGAK